MTRVTSRCDLLPAGREQARARRRPRASCPRAPRASPRPPSAARGLPKTRRRRRPPCRTPSTGRSPALGDRPRLAAAFADRLRGSDRPPPPRSRAATTSNGIRSCSRIARRCGERRSEHERRCRRDAHARLRARPDLLRRPLPRPLGGGRSRSSAWSLRAVRRVAARAKSLDLEPVLPQERQIQSPVPEVELDPLVVRPHRAGAGRTAALASRSRRSCLVRARRDSEREFGGTRARRPGGEAARPRGSTATGRTRSRRRTPRRRGRSSRPAAARSSALGLDRAGTRGRTLALHPPRRLELRGRDVERRRRAPAAAPARPTKYAVPQPSSTTSWPATSPRTPNFGLRDVDHTPQVDLLLRPGARAPAASVYSAFDLRPGFAVARARPRAQLIREPELDLALRRLRRVRPVHEVVGHRQREVAADRPGRATRPGWSSPSSCGRPGSPTRPRARARASARGDELDELAEERLLRVLGVVLARRARGRRGRAAPRASTRPAPLEAREDLAGQPALPSRRASPARGSAPPPRRRESTACADAYGRSARARGGRRALCVWPQLDGRRLDRRLAVRADLPERLERLLAVRARLAQPRRADRADEERRLDLGAADRAVQVAARASRCSIALISSSRSRTSSRYSGGRKSM